MPTQTICPGCFVTYSVPRAKVGQEAKCKRCSTVFVAGQGVEQCQRRALPRPAAGTIRLFLPLLAANLCPVIMFTLLMVASILEPSVFESPAIGLALMTLMGLGVITPTIWFYYELYHAWCWVIEWSTTTKHRPSFSPAVGVIGLFVPFYNIYCFYKWLSIGKDLNIVIRSLSLECEEVNETYGPGVAGLRVTGLLMIIISMCLLVMSGGIGIVAWIITVFIFLASDVLFLVFARNLERTINHANSMLRRSAH